MPIRFPFKIKRNPPKTTYDLTFKQALQRALSLRKTTIGHEDNPFLFHIDHVTKMLRVSIPARMKELVIDPKIFLDNGWWIR